MVVVSVSLPSELLRRLEEVMARMGYRSRSELMKDALVEFMASRLGEGESPYTVIVVSSNHDEEPKVDKRIVDVIHDYAADVVSYQHQMLEGGLCVTTVVVRGPLNATAALVRALRGVRGVKDVKVVGVG